MIFGGLNRPTLHDREPGGTEPDVLDFEAITIELHPRRWQPGSCRVPFTGNLDAGAHAGLRHDNPTPQSADAIDETSFIEAKVKHQPAPCVGDRGRLARAIERYVGHRVRSQAPERDQIRRNAPARADRPLEMNDVALFVCHALVYDRSRYDRRIGRRGHVQF